MGIGRPFLLRFPWSPTWAEVALVSRLACVLVLVSAVALLASILIFPAHAQSQSPQYLATAWQTEQGLPKNSVNAMVQDHRGYLWIGTFGGLARFDGQRFTVFESGDTPGLGSDQILSLYESRSGVLWIGTVGGGLIRLENGIATTYTERDGLPSGFISSIRGDAEGKCGSTHRGAWHILSVQSWSLIPVSVEKRSGNFFCRRGTEACGSVTEKMLCVSEPMAPRQT